MILSCLCGGIIEIIVLGIVSFLAPLLAVYRYNVLQKKKCECVCHEEHKPCIK
jgi:hypothetical protein